MSEAFRRGLARLVNVLLRAQSRPYPFPGGTALFVAPHADDETLGCGGLIAAKARRGDSVLVVFVSDSAAGSAGRRPPADGLVARRRAEALAALRELGVPGCCAHFFNAPDGRLDRLDFGESQRLHGQLVELLRLRAPEEIFVPYLGDGSPGRDAVVWLVRDALAVVGGRSVLWEYPVWASRNPLRLCRQLARFQENFHFELGPLRRVKCAALSCHESQVQAASAPALPSSLAEACTGPVEFYFCRPP